MHYIQAWGQTPFFLRFQGGEQPPANITRGSGDQDKRIHDAYSIRKRRWAAYQLCDYLFNTSNPYGEPGTAYLLIRLSWMRTKWGQADPFLSLGPPPNGYNVPQGV